MSLLQERGVQFSSLTDGIDTTTPAGRFFFHVMASLAEMERELMAERTRAAPPRRKKQEEELRNQAGCLNLMTNAVVTWNTVYMAAVIDQLRAEGRTVKEEDIARLSPARYEHINPYGKYRFEVEEGLSRAHLRPLRQPTEQQS